MTNKKKEEFALAFAGSGKQGASALQAGYSEASAPAMGHRLFKDPSVRLRIRELMDNAGATEDVLIGRMNTLSESAKDERVRFRATQDMMNGRGLEPEPDDEVSARALIKLRPGSDPADIIIEIKRNLRTLNPLLLEMLEHEQGQGANQDSERP